MRVLTSTVASAVLALSAQLCCATDRSFPDIVAFSPDNEWKVTAASPDNHPALRRVWQADFVYSAFRGTKPVWTRKQSEQAPHESSPVDIFVDDRGWVAVHTGTEQLIFIDPTGRNRGRVNNLLKVIPQDDLATRGIESSGGLIWSPYSLWYFLPIEDEQFFVVRLWWGRRIIIDPETGNLVPETDRIRESARQRETERAIALLAKYHRDPIPDSDVSDILLGAYLAGVLHIEEVIPWLRDLERSEYVGIVGGRAGNRETDIKPFHFKCYSARQVSRLSLRRLGADTSSLPVYEFATSDDLGVYYRPDPVDEPVGSRFPLIEQGMTARDVLALVGSPDFVTDNAWEFDVAEPPAATYVIEWENDRVSTSRHVDPKWKQQLTRDLHIVLF